MAFLYSPPSSASGSSTYTISSKTANYTVISTDLGTVINCSGASSFTIALTAAATLGAGFNCVIWNSSTTTAMTVTIDPNGAETIDGKATLILRQSEGTEIVCDGTNWQTGAKKTMRLYTENAQATGTRPSATGANSLALGAGASSIGTGSTAFGFSSITNGSFGLALGYGAASGTQDYAVSIGTNSAGSGSVTATGLGAMALGGSYASGTDSFAAAIADNTSTYGAQGINSIAIGKQAKSTSSSSVAIGTGAIATTNFSVAIGYTAQTNNATYALALGAGAQAQGQYSTAIGMNSAGSGSVIGNAFGGSSGIGATSIGGSYASGTDSFAASIANITSTYGAQGTNSIALNDRAKASAGQSVAIGQLTQATGVSSVCLSGYGAVASATASIAIGTNYDFGAPTASGQSSIVIGDGVVATARYSVALGYGASSAVSGKFASSSGRFAATGDSQQASLVLRAATTDATATVLLSYSTPASATNQIILPSNSAFTFSIMVVARQSAAGGTASAAWKIEGLIRQEGTAASTTLVNYITTVISNVPGWTIAVSADTTNGGLAITATGAAATNIRWVATAQTSEVTYA